MFQINGVCTVVEGRKSEKGEFYGRIADGQQSYEIIAKSPIDADVLIQAPRLAPVKMQANIEVRVWNNALKVYLSGVRVLAADK